MSGQRIKDSTQKAWVIFSGQADLPWLKIFKPGFRHCFVLLNDGVNWLTLDPLSNYTDVCVHHVPNEFSMPLWLRDRGYKVVPAQLERSKKPAPWMVFTCVEAVKRVLGLHNRLIITPWQLYCHLSKTQPNHGSLNISPANPGDDDLNLKGELVWEV